MKYMVEESVKVSSGQPGVPAKDVPVNLSFDYDKKLYTLIIGEHGIEKVTGKQLDVVVRALGYIREALKTK